MENQNPENISLPQYLMPLLIASVLLSLTAVVLSAFSLTRSIDQDQQKEPAIITEIPVFQEEEVTEPVEEKIVEEKAITYRSGDFTFSVPQDAIVQQVDSGRGSFIGIYESGDEFNRSEGEGLIYSIMFTPTSTESGIATANSFAEWLNLNDTKLTNFSVTIGGLKFYEGSKGDSLAYYHYLEDTVQQKAVVITLPFTLSGNEKGLYIENSLNFNPTKEELNNAQQIR